MHRAHSRAHSRARSRARSSVLSLDCKTSYFPLECLRVRVRVRARARARISLLEQHQEETGTHSLVDKLKRSGVEGGHTLCSSCNVTVEEFAAGRATNSLQPDSEVLVRHLRRKGQENCRAGSRLVVNSFSGQRVGFSFPGHSKCLK